MCGPDGDDEQNLPAASAGSDGVSRRNLLRGALLLPWITQLPLNNSRLLAARSSAPRVVNGYGETARLMAMHLHGSFSEAYGSWEAHFGQAAKNGLDVIVPTEHDWRAQLLNYRQAYHFTGMSETGPDGTWRLLTSRAGGLAASSTATISSVPSPADPSGGSLYLLAAASGTGAGSLSVLVDDVPARKNYKGTLLGRTLGLSVYPIQSVRASPVSLRVTCSLHPSVSPKPLTVSYAFCTDASSATYAAAGGVGTVTLPATGNSWNTTTLDLQSDLQQLWPGIVAADNAIYTIEFVATAQGSQQAEGRFAALTLAHDSGYDALSAQDSVISSYVSQYPSLLVLSGSEDSFDHHFCRIGGTRFFYNYPATQATNPSFGSAVATDQVTQIKAHGGVASVNHPFGAEGAAKGLLSQSQQDALRAKVAQTYLNVKAYGADVLEVGYVARAGADLAHHQQLWDTLSRNGIYLTADGVSDDHSGKSWLQQQNRFLTCPWTSALDESSLQTALRAGRAFVGLLGDFVGASRGASAGIDLDMEGVRMGQVSLRTGAGLASRTLTINAQGLPSGSSVVVVQGPVDYAGPGTPAPGTASVTSLPASAFAASGSASVLVNTSSSMFVRVEIVSSAGTTIAFSNPIWQLREQPPSSAPVPQNRLSSF